MRTKFIILVLLQVLLLAGIIGYREYWIAVGEKIIFRTAPVDPRDLFRGDYVRLSYEISNLDLDRFAGTESFKPNQAIYVTLDRDEDGTCTASGVRSVPPAEGVRFIQGRVRNEQSMERWDVVMQDDQGKQHLLEPRWFSGIRKGDRVVFCLRPDGTVLNHYRVDSRAKPSCEPGRSLEGMIEEIREAKIRRAIVDYGIESYFVEEGKGLLIERAQNARGVKVEVALRNDGKAIITGLVMDGGRVSR
jgi:uncharacterized membrane-anchored protein